MSYKYLHHIRKQGPITLKEIRNEMDKQIAAFENSLIHEYQVPLKSSELKNPCIVDMKISLRTESDDTCSCPTYTSEFRGIRFVQKMECACISNALKY